MSDDSVYYDPDEFLQNQVKPLVEQTLEASSSKLRALGLLDQMDTAAEELGAGQ